jgi:hypothetical protein
MFSDIREDGMSYESSSDSDLNNESTSLHENQPSSTSESTTNFDNINMPNGTGSTTETSNVADRVRKILDFMSTVNLDLTGFLDALSWGDTGCFNDPKIRYARSSFLKSKRLPIILHHWWKPLRTPGSHNKRPEGATETMQKFAITCLEEIYVKELNNLSESFSSPAGDDVTEDDLKSTQFVDAIQKAQENAPHLWSVLYGLSTTKKQVTRNTHKKPDKVRLILRQ